MKKLTENYIKLLKTAEKKTNEILTRNDEREMEKQKKLFIAKVGNRVKNKCDGTETFRQQ